MNIIDTNTKSNAWQPGQLGSCLCADERRGWSSEGLKDESGQTPLREELFKTTSRPSTLSRSLQSTPHIRRHINYTWIWVCGWQISHWHFTAGNLNVHVMRDRHPLSFLSHIDFRSDQIWWAGGGGGRSAETLSRLLTGRKMSSSIFGRDRTWGQSNEDGLLCVSSRPGAEVWQMRLRCNAVHLLRELAGWRLIITWHQWNFTWLKFSTWRKRDYPVWIKSQPCCFTFPSAGSHMRMTLIQRTTTIVQGTLALLNLHQLGLIGCLQIWSTLYQMW